MEYCPQCGFHFLNHLDTECDFMFKEDHWEPQPESIYNRYADELPERDYYEGNSPDY